MSLTTDVIKYLNSHQVDSRVVSAVADIIISHPDLQKKRPVRNKVTVRISRFQPIKYTKINWAYTNLYAIPVNHVTGIVHRWIEVTKHRDTEVYLLMSNSSVTTPEIKRYITADPVNWFKEFPHLGSAFHVANLGIFKLTPNQGPPAPDFLVVMGDHSPTGFKVNNAVGVVTNA